MSIKSTHGNGQKTLVRIEWNDGVGGAVRRAEFEDSDDEFGDGVAGPAWCIYYALDMLHGGCQLSVAEECARALALCEEFDDVSAGDKPEYIRERQLLKTAHEAALNWSAYRLERLATKKEADDERTQ